MTTRNPNRLSVAIDALSADAAAPVAPSEFRLFRAGANETSKGVFLFNDVAAASVLAAAKRWGVRLSIDYNHGMLDGWPVDPSAAGKSAGSFVLDVRSGELWATDVKWTPAAKLAVESREWLYISPAFYNEDDGTISELINVALTNIPATHNLDPLIALAALRASDNRKANGMTFKGTLALLSLGDTATDGDAVAALTARLAPITELCALTGKATAAEALGVVRAGVAALTSLAVANTELAKVRSERLATTIEDAIKAGKVAPAQRESLLSWGAANPDGLATFLAAAVAIVPMDGAGKTPAPVAADATLTDAEQAVCTQLGIKPADFVAARNAGK